MFKVYKMVEWQAASGVWYVNVPGKVGTAANAWWVPPRILDIPVNDYVLLLREEYGAENIKYFEDSNTLIFSFPTQLLARKYKNWINTKARNKNFLV